MADGIEVEQMVESRPKKVNFFYDKKKKLLYGEFLSFSLSPCSWFYACLKACGLMWCKYSSFLKETSDLESWWECYFNSWKQFLCVINVCVDINVVVACSNVYLIAWKWASTCCYLKQRLEFSSIDSRHSLMSNLFDLGQSSWCVIWDQENNVEAIILTN